MRVCQRPASRPIFPRAAALGAICCTVIGAAGGPPRFSRFLAQWDGLSDPAAAAVAPDGRVVVAEASAGRVTVFAAPEEGKSGRVLRVVGSDVLMDPVAVAIGDRGALFVADRAGGVVRVFGETQAADVTGSRDPALSVRTIGEGVLVAPTGLALTGGGLVVADGGADRVRVFDGAGKLVSDFGGFGSGDGNLRGPGGVAVDQDGAIFVADNDNHRIAVFEGDGRWRGAWGAWGFQNGMFAAPTCVTILDDAVYVTDRDGHRVQVFTREGRFLSRWGVHAIKPREGEGKLHYPNHLSIAPDGRFAVLCEAFSDRCQIFNAAQAGDSEPMLTPFGPESGASHPGRRIATHGKLLALTQPDGHSVEIFDASTIPPVLLSIVGGFGDKPGQFNRPEGLAFSRDGELLYVADGANRRMQAFQLDRALVEGETRYHPRLARLARVAAMPAGDSSNEPGAPAAITVGADDRVYVLDVRWKRVVAFARDFSVSGMWSLGEAAQPRDIAADDALIAVLLANEPMIVRFRADGSRVDAWPVRPAPTADHASGAAAAPAAEKIPAIAHPSGLAVVGWSDGDAPEGGRMPSVAWASPGAGAPADAYSRYLVSDERSGVIAAVSSRGVEAVLGGVGLGPVEFFKPAGLVVGANGRVFVVDYGNHRVQALNASGGFEGALGSRWFVEPAQRGMD